MPAAALSSLDPHRILPYYHEPLTLITAPITSILSTRADTEQWLKSRGEQMKGRGYTRNAWDHLHIKQLENGVAVASGCCWLTTATGAVAQIIPAAWVMDATRAHANQPHLKPRDGDAVLRLRLPDVDPSRRAPDVHVLRRERAADLRRPTEQARHGEHLRAQGAQQYGPHSRGFGLALVSTHASQLRP